jgi:hypothetical protein
MSYFTTRVELLNHATAADYLVLHAAMGAEGFSRIVTGGDGRRYHLPPAEYLKEGDFAIADVLNAAVRASTSTGKHMAVLVTEGTRLTWVGLRNA